MARDCKQITISGTSKKAVTRLYKSKKKENPDYSYSDLMKELLSHYPNYGEQFDELFSDMFKILKLMYPDNNCEFIFKLQLFIRKYSNDPDNNKFMLDDLDMILDKTMESE